MNITKESTGSLTALVKIEICPDDYAASVEKQIADYKRKANIPGFRPGHIPTGLIKKMYGKAILADEVNKLISDSLVNYIRDQKVDILGNPIPNVEKNAAIDFENQDSFEFYFDLGLAPEFTIPLDQDLQIENYSITVDDEMVNKYIEDTRKRFGKPVEVPIVEAETTLDVVTDDPPAELSETAETSDIEEPTAPVQPSEPDVEPADMDPDFFDMVYPGLNLQTEEEFREQVKKDAAMSFAAETDKLLFNNITEALVKNTELPLPDEFLKRWLLENNENKYTPEEIEKNYSSFSESMKWQLIENKLIRENDITVTDNEIRDYIGTNMLRQISLTDLDPEMQKRYESIIDTFMQNKKQVERIYDQLYNSKMMNFFKSVLKFQLKEISYDDYIKMVSERHKHNHAHEHEHDHKHDHDHEHKHDHEHEPDQHH
ncbi:MAG: trigger factor [Bacteroidales bacterium]|nr:trigger factor [Bacteroidales bacterium]